MVDCVESGYGYSCNHVTAEAEKTARISDNTLHIN